MRGIVLRDASASVPRSAKIAGFQMIRQDSDALPWERTLFIRGEVNVPGELLAIGFDFLDKWECAAPMWRYDVIASDVARGEDARRTVELIHDLRVPLYAYELLFMRDCERGQALLKIWDEECMAFTGTDPRLAFVRALYRVKPLFLALPNSWLGGTGAGRRTSANVARITTLVPLVRVEIAPGRFVRCRQGDEEKVRREFEERALSRAQRRDRDVQRANRK